MPHAAVVGHEVDAVDADGVKQVGEHVRLDVERHVGAFDGLGVAGRAEEDHVVAGG